MRGELAPGGSDPATVSGGATAPIIRQVALILAAVAAYVLHTGLGTGNAVLWILGATALANLVVSLLSTHRRFFLVSPALSSLAGVCGWAVLIHLTGGSASPFVAGLGLEVVLAASAFGLAGMAAVALGSVLALWIQQAPLGIEGARIALILQSLLLVATGTASAALRQQWARARDMARVDAIESRRRLEALERRMEDLRRAGQVGTNVARLTHGLKNAAGSMRGFASLIEGRLGPGEGAGQLVGGLRAAVERLEEISRLILDPPPDEAPRQTASPVAADQVIERAIDRASVKHRDIEWVRVGGAGGSPVLIGDGLLDEILEVLLDNAAESMNGRGQVKVLARAEGRSLEIRVCDQGEGIPWERTESLFRPGCTTKETGSGFGLYVARQLAEALGGSLDVVEPGPRGASFRVTVPVAEAG